jgi:hypothetical protein
MNKFQFEITGADLVQFDKFIRRESSLNKEDIKSNVSFGNGKVADATLISVVLTATVQVLTTLIIECFKNSKANALTIKRTLENGDEITISMAGKTLEEIELELSKLGFTNTHLGKNTN